MLPLRVGATHPVRQHADLNRVPSSSPCELKFGEFIKRRDRPEPPFVGAKVAAAHPKPLLSSLPRHPELGAHRAPAGPAGTSTGHRLGKDAARMRLAPRGRSDQPKMTRLIQFALGLKIGIREDSPTDRIGEVSHRGASWLGSQAPEVAALVRRMPAPMPAA